MKLFPGRWRKKREQKEQSLNQVLQMLEALAQTASGESVTPKTAMECASFHSIVRAVSSKLGTLPVSVFRREVKSLGGDTQREVKIRLRDHAITRLINNPNPWTTRYDYMSQAANWLMRYGAHYAFMQKGRTGPVRRLQLLPPPCVDPPRVIDGHLVFGITTADKGHNDYGQDKVHFVRSLSDDGVVPQSPVALLRNAIGLEMAAEKFGSSFFANGAVPFTLIKRPGHFGSVEAGMEWLNSFVEAFNRKNARRAMLLEDGWDVDSMSVNNEESQFLETRKLQRSVLAGGWNVPPHKTGDLERATFNNVEQQNLEYIGDAILPVVTNLELAMERDFLSKGERDDHVIRFNLDAALRAAFKTRQEGLDIQRRAGVINPNDWREMENKNPISEEDGGEDFRVLVNTVDPKDEQPQAPPGPPDPPAAPDEE